MSIKSTQSHCQHCGTDTVRSGQQTVRNPEWESIEGCPRSLGVTWLESEQAYNFALYSEDASSVTLLLYTRGEICRPLKTIQFDPLRNKSGAIWHCRVPISDAVDAEYYAYKVDGPVDNVSTWHDFQPSKILLDPYARSIFFPDQFDREAARSPGANAGLAPLGRLDVCRCPFDWGDEPRIRHGSDLVIYEMHVRGFTQHPHSGVSSESRGTFTGIVDKIPYLRELGITAVELMPVFQFDPADNNYWGYMPLSFFAPHHGYSTNQSSCEQHSQFREMVRALHSAEIEVILDVVFNHTCEGDHRGPTYSYRGIGNSTYYMPSGDPARPYANFSGTGNTLNTANSAVRRLILDSLRYWVSEMHVDGFRFDLASVFSRSGNGNVELSQPPLFDQIASDPTLAHTRLIAEPWDASGLCQLGTSFPDRRWMQWNGRYRDCLQRFMRGDGGMIGELMTRLYGSSDLFPDDTMHAFRPFHSVNYVSSHDGSTMYDLVSYNDKHNEANGHNNQDGPNEHSWNCGVEGEEEASPAVLALRRRQLKNLCCLLMLSAGTPMFRMGDEFMHTQRGNNNPYNQDNETSWIDWRRLEDNQDLFQFFKRMIAFRKSLPLLGGSTFWRDRIRWFGSEHQEVDLSTDSRLLAYCLRGERDNCTTGIYVMINGSNESRTFRVHAAGRSWRRVVDTSLSFPLDIVDAGSSTDTAHSYHVKSRSVVVFIQ